MDENSTEVLIKNNRLSNVISGTTIEALIIRLIRELEQK